MSGRSIFGVLLSLDEDHLLLPNVAVLEVGNVMDVAADGWLCGEVDFESRRVPLVDFVALNRRRPSTLSRARPVFLQMPEACEPGVVALLCRGHPHLVDVEPQALTADALGENDRAELLLCRARLGTTRVAIPRLEGLAAELAAATAGGETPP